MVEQKDSKIEHPLSSDAMQEAEGFVGLCGKVTFVKIVRCFVGSRTGSSVNILNVCVCRGG